MAWRTRPDNLEQYARLGFVLKIVCKGCARTLLADAGALARHLRHRGLPTDRIRGGERLRCQQCGAQWPALEWEMLDLPDDGPTKPRPRAASLPATVDQIERAARICEALCDGTAGDDKLRDAAQAIRDHAWDD